MVSLFGVEVRPRLLAGAAMEPQVGDLVEPLLQMVSQLGLIAESLAIIRILRDMAASGSDTSHGILVGIHGDLLEHSTTRPPLSWWLPVVLRLRDLQSLEAGWLGHKQKVRNYPALRVEKI